MITTGDNANIFWEGCLDLHSTQFQHASNEKKHKYDDQIRFQDLIQYLIDYKISHWHNGKVGLDSR